MANLATGYKNSKNMFLWSGVKKQTVGIKVTAVKAAVKELQLTLASLA